MEIWATSLYFSLKLSSIGWGNYLDGWLGIISCVVEVFLLVFVFIWLVRITFIIFPIKPLRVTEDMTNASQSKPPSILFSLECLKTPLLALRVEIMYCHFCYYWSFTLSLKVEDLDFMPIDACRKHLKVRLLKRYCIENVPLAV